MACSYQFLFLAPSLLSIMRFKIIFTSIPGGCPQTDEQSGLTRCPGRWKQPQVSNAVSRARALEGHERGEERSGGHSPVVLCAPCRPRQENLGEETCELSPWRCQEDGHKKF